jgi:hypothetical protein
LLCFYSVPEFSKISEKSKNMDSVIAQRADLGKHPRLAVDNYVGSRLREYAPEQLPGIGVRIIRRVLAEKVLQNNWGTYLAFLLPDRECLAEKKVQ